MIIHWTNESTTAEVVSNGVCTFDSGKLGVAYGGGGTANNKTWFVVGPFLFFLSLLPLP